MLIEPHYVENLRRIFVSRISTLIALIKTKYWGIKIQQGIYVFGKIYFRRKPGSEIFIGAKCKFNSAFTSNLIGINRPCMISTILKGAEIRIGNKCGFSGTVIGAFKLIQLGDNVRCGANTLITDSDWHFDDSRSGEPESVKIEDNVWLGVNVIVLKGVTIGKNSVIGAGSVVTKSIPANVVAAGNPCKIIRELNPSN